MPRRCALMAEALPRRATLSSASAQVVHRSRLGASRTPGRGWDGDGARQADKGRCGKDGVGRFALSGPPNLGAGRLWRARIPMGGVFISRGMTLAIPPGGLTLSLSEAGEPTGNLTLHVRFDVCPSWLGLAIGHLREAQARQAERIEAWKTTDGTIRPRLWRENSKLPCRLSCRLLSRSMPITRSSAQ